MALLCRSGLENILKGYTRRVDGSQMRLDEPAEKGDEPGPKVFVVAVEVTPPTPFRLSLVDVQRLAFVRFRSGNR